MPSRTYPALRVIKTDGTDPGVGGIVTSNSGTGSFNTSSTSYVAINDGSADLICTLTVRGNPVRIELFPVTENARIQTSSSNGNLKFEVSGVEVASCSLGIDERYSPQSFSVTVTGISAGSHTFMVYVKLAGAGLFDVIQTKIRVYELN